MREEKSGKLTCTLVQIVFSFSPIPTDKCSLVKLPAEVYLFALRQLTPLYIVLPCYNRYIYKKSGKQLIGLIQSSLSSCTSDNIIFRN